MKRTVKAWATVTTRSGAVMEDDGDLRVARTREQAVMDARWYGGEGIPCCVVRCVITYDDGRKAKRKKRAAAGGPS